MEIESKFKRKIKLIDNWSNETRRHRIQSIICTVTGELLETPNDSSIDYWSNEMQLRE
jgi:hypothetical protein